MTSSLRVSGRRVPQFGVLLAKWDPVPEAPRRQAARLSQHLADVTDVAEYLVASWGRVALASVGLDEDPWLPRLGKALPRAAFLHDLGKANDHYQRMIRHPGAVTQAFRHESISLWAMLSDSELRGWLCHGCDELTEFAILAAAAGHHLKFGGDFDLQPRSGSQAFELWFLGGHTDLVAILQWASTALRLRPPPVLPNVAIGLTTRNPLRLVGDWLMDSDEWWHAQDHDARVFVGLVKALVIGSDVAASAVPKSTEMSCREWARRTLASTCSAPEIERAIAVRLGSASGESVATSIYDRLRPFQRAVCESPRRVTFVRAGCGSGKTLAAYAWAVRRAQGRKLFFTYPTTGTATAGFADYVADVDELDSVLVHSRANVDLVEILDNREEVDGGEQIHLLADRLVGLESWGAQLTVSTVDAVLGLIQNRRRGLFASPALVNGAFVFDEIHQYDESLFDALVQFLSVFRGAPVLLMTASLQASRLARLYAVASELADTIEIVNGPADLEAYPRYRLGTCNVASARRAASAALARGEKVLWVSNRVRRCQSIAASFGESSMTLVYHSRFRYVDRVQRHRAVVESFKRSGALLASTTQVCEISLDLSADLLVTDLANVPALIQRLGRLNRAHPESGPKQALVLPIEDDQARPYAAAELSIARTWLAELGDDPVSQTDLNKTFERLAIPDPPHEQRTSAWVDGGPTATPAPLRDDGTTIPVLLPEDAPDRSPDAVMRHSIPMPFGPVAREIGEWKRAGAAVIAPPGRMHYDALTGGSWV